MPDFDSADQASAKPANDRTTSFRGVADTAPVGTGPSTWPEFPGHEILGQLGAGGMGVVYKERDIKRDSIVALKTLLHFGAADLYRFKQEFRALADLNHANLVMLYQMLSAGEQWCFTMELVEGQDFLSALRPAAPPDAPTGVFDPVAVPATPLPTSQPSAFMQACDEDRLRDEMRQLCKGLNFLP